MVGVGVEAGGGGAEPYYGEYYPPEQYYVPQEMCPHPQQHPQHTHMCTVHAEYGGMPVVTSGTMMPQMMPPVMEDMRHYLVAHPHHSPHPHHTPHHQPHHQQQLPPQHQPPHHYGPANGGGGPQHFYPGGFQPHYHMPPHPIQHYQPPPVYQKDERTQRQYTKLKQKLERKHNNRTNGIEVNSGASTPSLSPRKELNGRGAQSGAWSEGEGSSAGASLQSDEDCDTQTFLDQLSAKRTPQVSDVTPTSALVQWNSPLPEGVPSPPLDLTYDLLLGDRGRYKAIYSGPKLSCRVCDLRPGCEYSVRLQIRAGEAGATSEEATFRAPCAPPARPPPPRVTQRTRTSLQLRWQTVQDNGARVTHYLLEAEGGAVEGGEEAGAGAGEEAWREVARPRTRQHTCNELRPQTRYRFRLCAVNECGRGEWSEETTAWTAGAPPPAPRPPRLLRAGTDTLTLAWDRRTPEEEYTLQMDSGPHGYLPVYTGLEEGHQCTGLRRATDYRFRLCSETADGQGPWSPEVTYRTLPAHPAPPGRPTLRGKPHARSLRLRWEPPQDDGGAPVHTYTLELDAGGGAGYREAYCGPEREAHCDRLLPGTEYRARVLCASDAGRSEPSPVETVSTEPACPAAPSAPALCAPPRAASAAARWRAPECTGGAALLEYRADLTELEGEGTTRLAYAGLETECALRDLAPGRRYSLCVTAVNRVGSGPASAPLVFTAAAAPPDPPSPPHLELLSPRSARLEWSAPRDNGAPVLDYRLEVSSSESAESFREVYRGPATSHVVADLTPFCAYLFRVCACNAAGRGAWSGVRDALTPRAPPAAPAPPRYEAEATSLRLEWTPPADHGAAILHYVVRVEEPLLELESVEPAREVSGLRPDAAYRIRVAAVSELGRGDWSEPVRAQTRPPPPAPPPLQCAQRAHNYLKLKWGEGASDSTQYRLEMRSPESREFRPAYRGSARSCKVKKLREASSYAFRIRASDERGGRGEWSEPLEAATTAAPPPAPRAPTVECAAGGMGRAGLAVSWEASEGCEYLVQTCRAGGAWRQAWSGAGARCSLEEAEAGPGAEVLVRVCGGREGQWGGWSAVTRVQLPAASGSTVSRSARAPRPPRTATRHLAPRHAALLMAGGFLLVAVLVAAVLQTLVEPRP